MKDATNAASAGAQGESTDADLQNEVVDRLYSVAIDPERLPELFDPWHELLEPQWRRPSKLRQAMLAESGLISHVGRVEQIVERMQGPSKVRPEIAELRAFRHSAAFTLDRKLRISAANLAAHKTLGIVLGAPLSRLGIRSEDLAVLMRVASSLLKGQETPGAEAAHLIRARRTSDDRLVLVQTRLIRAGERPDFVLVVTTDLYWPDHATQVLRDAFGLTQAEAEVLKAMTENKSLIEIAKQRGRAVDTVRTQVKSIQAKTETRGQTDLLRLAIITMDIAVPTEAEAGLRSQDALAPRMARAGLELAALPFHTIHRPDGRCIDYLEFGDPEGTPLIYLCSSFGLCRWPAAAEFTAVRMGLRVIVPIRPGYGGSDALPNTADRKMAVVQDILAVMDRLNVAAAPLLVVDADMIFAAQLFAEAPDRVTAVLGCSALLPLTRPEQYQRMGHWQRFVLGVARYTPQFLPFAARTGFALVRQIGKAEFVRLAFGASAADREMTRNPRTFEAVDCGSDTVLSESQEAVRAYADEISLFHSDDWHADFRTMCAAIPVLDLIGTEDQTMAAATVTEFTRDFPEVGIERIDGAGSFLLFQKWPTVLQRLDRLTQNGSFDVTFRL